MNLSPHASSIPLPLPPRPPPDHLFPSSRFVRSRPSPAASAGAAFRRSGANETVRSLTPWRKCRASSSGSPSTRTRVITSSSSTRRSWTGCPTARSSPNSSRRTSSFGSRIGGRSASGWGFRCKVEGRGGRRKMGEEERGRKDGWVEEEEEKTGRRGEGWRRGDKRKKLRLREEESVDVKEKREGRKYKMNGKMGRWGRKKGPRKEGCEVMRLKLRLAFVCDVLLERFVKKTQTYRKNGVGLFLLFLRESSFLT